MTIHDPDLRPATVPPPAPSQAEAGGILTIDLAAIEANWKKLASTTVPVECAGAKISQQIGGQAYSHLKPHPWISVAEVNENTR